VLVAGTAIFGSEDPTKTIEEMRSQADEALAKGV
jgi:pentose-5-phosphate-3-epimerase